MSQGMKFTVKKIREVWKGIPLDRFIPLVVTGHGKGVINSKEPYQCKASYSVTILKLMYPPFQCS